jgi:hypothetical protein
MNLRKADGTMKIEWRLAGLEQIERELAQAEDDGDRAEAEHLRGAWQEAREAARAQDPDALWAWENR